MAGLVVQKNIANLRNACVLQFVVANIQNLQGVPFVLFQSLLYELGTEVGQLIATQIQAD